MVHNIFIFEVGKMRVCGRDPLSTFSDVHFIGLLKNQQNKKKMSTP